MSSDRQPADFGSKLREARERRGVTLRQIANATKIAVSVLDALERNDISRLPGGIFGRAFVRSYAIEVGLDPEATIQDFIAQFPHDSVTQGHPTAEQTEDNVKVESDRRMAGTFLSLIALSIPIAGAVLYFGTATGRRAAVQPPAAPAVALPAPEPKPAIETPSLPVPEPATAVTPRPSAPAAETPTETPAAAPATAPAAAAAVVAPPAPADSDVLTVGLSVKRPCWVSATVDGQKKIERLLASGNQQTLEVHREMVLTAGDAAAIGLTLNGADARPLGKAGDVVTVRLTPANFKDYLQAR